MPEDLFAGRYRRLEPLGKGAMASVWLAEDTELGRRVALKLLRPDADRERFRREARAVAALAHPNVCRLYDFGESAEGPFMVLEYLPGGSLEDRLQPGVPLPDEETARIATEIADGLAHAHANGLVHRDLKPANILFDGEDRAKIADFGIVRIATDTGKITETGTVLGTAQYISPEQTAGETATPPSDVYSFGVILFHMLTGRLPFESTSVIDLVRRHRSEPPPSVTDLRPDAPEPLAALALAALAKEPAARPADGAALLAALSQGIAAVSSAAAPEGATTLIVPPARPPRRVVRNVAIGAAATLLLLTAGVGVALLATDNGGSGSVGTPPSTAPSSAPTVQTAPTTSTGASTSTEQTPSTTEPTTTEPTTTSSPITTPTRPTTSARTTTASATTEPVTTEPVTTEPPATTEPSTTDTGSTTTTGTVTP